MHPDILRDLVKAHTSDLHRQAGRNALSLAARRARHASAKQGTPFMPAHTTAEFIRRVLALLGARKRSLQKFKIAPIWARRRRLPRVSLAFCGVLSAALAAVILVAAIASPAVVIFLVGAVLSVLAGGALCVHYLRSEIAADIDPQLQQMQNQLDVIESALNLAPAVRYAEMNPVPPRLPAPGEVHS
jgi:Flp pilus assembly protein TadB